MPDLGVTHLPVRQADEVLARANQRVRILPQEAVVVRLACQGNRIAVCLRTMAPAIENRQDYRAALMHHCRSL